jgi:proline iminopeptidase
MVSRAVLAPAAATLALMAAACSSAEEAGRLVPPTADQDPALPQTRITVAGHTRSIHIETAGDPANPSLLVLHGSISDYRSLRFLRALADEYFVVLWDQRGNGLSERVSAAEYTWDSVVEEIDAIKRLHSPDRPVVLVGHSFGAMYAALYMSRRPDNVQGAVLMEPAGLNGKIFTETFSSIIRVDLFGEGLNRTFWQSEVLSASDHELLDYKALLLLTNGHATSYFCDPDHPPHIPVWRPGAHVEYLRGLRMGAAGFTSTTFTFDFAAGLETFPHKVLILGAACSALGYDFQLEHTRPLFRDAEVAQIPRAGHRLTVEQPDLVVHLVRRYLAQQVK